MSKHNPFARFPDYATTNRYFTLVCTSFPAVLGSAVSFVFHGGAIWCAATILSGRQRLSRDPAMLRLAAALYAFVAISTFSTLVNGGREYVWVLLSGLSFLAFPFSYSIWKISKKDEIISAAVVGCAISCVGSLLISIFQYFFLSMRAEGGAGNSIVFATVVAIAMSVTLAGHFHIDRKWRFLLSVSYAAGFVALILSESRMGWFAVILTSLAAFWIYRRQMVSRISKRTALQLTVIASVVCMIAILPVTQRVKLLIDDWQNLSTPESYETSLGIRSAMWQVGIASFKEAPIIGHGQADTRTIVSQGLRNQFGIKLSFTHFHNGFLTAMVETGLCGMVALLAIFAVLIHNAAAAFRSDPEPAARFGGMLLVTTIIVYLCMGSVNIMFGHDILDVVFMVMAELGIYLGLGRSTVSINDRADAALAPADTQRPV